MTGSEWDKMHVFPVRSTFDLSRLWVLIQGPRVLNHNDVGRMLDMAWMIPPDYS